MGYYEVIDSESDSIKSYASKLGTVITIFNYLDYKIQIFIEAILDLDNDKSTTKPIIQTTRTFDFSKRIKFLKLLIKTKHKGELKEYNALHEEIIKTSKIRNNFAHSQIYFWDDPTGAHMMISNMKQSELPPHKAYKELKLKDLDNQISELQKLKNKFDSFTYKLGYFQGHKV